MGASLALQASAPHSPTGETSSLRPSPEEIVPGGAFLRPRCLGRVGIPLLAENIGGVRPNLKATGAPAASALQTSGQASIRPLRPRSLEAATIAAKSKPGRPYREISSADDDPAGPQKKGRGCGLIPEPILRHRSSIRSSKCSRNTKAKCIMGCGYGVRRPGPPAGAIIASNA